MLVSKEKQRIKAAEALGFTVSVGPEKVFDIKQLVKNVFKK